MGGYCHGNADKPGGLNSSKCGSLPDMETAQDGIEFLQQELNGVHKASEYSQTAEQVVLTQFREENDAAARCRFP